MQFEDNDPAANEICVNNESMQLGTVTVKDPEINCNSLSENMQNSLTNPLSSCMCDTFESCKESDVFIGENEVSYSDVSLRKTGDNILVYNINIQVTVEPKLSVESVLINEICEGDSVVEKQMSLKPQPEIDYSKGVDVTTIKLKSKDYVAQVDSTLKNYKFFNLIKNRDQLSTATGIDSFHLLNVLIEKVKVATETKYESKKFVMKTADRVVMAYVKLKQSLSYSFLALIFDSVTPEHCRTIFIETVRVLSKCLTLAIPWPSKNEISKNMLKCFEGYKDTRIVLDCTEVYIQKPKKLCSQILTYSNYKGAQTAKLMTGVTSSGNISFVSKAYGGKASDSAIFEQSDLIKLLEPGDGVMMDKGFLIKEICEKHQFKFFQPPFLRKKVKFSKEESLGTVKVAKARVHIKRSNQRLKVFKTLGTVMPASLVPYQQDIFTIICGTVNLSAPILADDKFMLDEMDPT